MSEFNVLPLNNPGKEPLPLPVHRVSATLRDSALVLFTDLRSGPCVVISASNTLDEALKLMLHAGVRMALVGEASGGIGAVSGILTANDVLGERPVQRALAAGVSRHDLHVGDLMTPLSSWGVVPFDAAVRAQVGDIVATMQSHGQRYLLVGENTENGLMLRGLFSATRIEQALGEPLRSDELRSRSFAQLEAALHHE
ncbi:MAG TPA: CBS domain-containing protein [Burkholderiaceae bacterium]|jgi:CBS domain-containing protein|nr:CBS domain-containing protein [Burkholderiaceae bacterium]